MNRSLVILAFVVALLSQSCKSSREATTQAMDFPNMKTSELVDSVKSHDQGCGWVSIKYDVEIKTNKIDDSFKLYARLRKDSAIWISATYYAVEVARFLFTPDSVKFMDRRNNQFYIGGYDYITEKFLVEADFNTLQALILGNGGAFVDAYNEKMHSSKTNGGYKLSYLKDSQLRRAMKKEDGKTTIDQAVSMNINPKTFRVSSTTILDIEDERSLVTSYGDHKSLCGSSQPHATTFEASSANEQALVKTSIIKVSSGKKVSLSFTIPDKYEPLPR